MIILKTPDEIDAMRPACDLISRTMGIIAANIREGVTTQSLDTIAREFIRDNGGKPACLGYGGFPATLCIEVNETVVHGFPTNYALRNGDIIGIDTVVEKDGFMGDMCYTFAVGPKQDLDPRVLALLETTKQSLEIGIEQCVPGRRIGDISNAVQQYCEKRGYSVVREMCGHGIGRHMHEDPEVPNYGRRGCGPQIRPGMVLCIEPMINLGSRNIIIERDGWTCRTRDRQPSAHFEHTIAVTRDGNDVLTTFKYIEDALGQNAI